MQNPGSLNFLGVYPVTTVTPFTYREGATMLHIMEKFKNWAIDLGPEVQSIVDEALAKWQVEFDKLEVKVDNRFNQWQTLFDAFMADVVVQLEALNDQAVSNLVRNELSLLRAALNDVLMPSDRKNPITGKFQAEHWGLREENSALVNGVIIDSIINAMERGDTLSIPKGVFKTTPFEITGKHIRIEGEGVPNLIGQLEFGDPRWLGSGYVFGSVLRFEAFSGVCLNIPDTVANNNTVISNLGLVGPGGGSSIGIYAGHDASGGLPVRIRFDNVSIGNFSVGFRSTSENSQFDSLFITGCDVGLSTRFPFNGNTFNAINVERCATKALDLISSNINIFNGGVIQGNKTPISVYIKGHGGNVFKSVYFEDHGPANANSFYQVWVDGGIKNRFIDCTFNANPEYGAKLHIGGSLNEIDGTNGPIDIEYAGTNNRFRGQSVSTRSIVDTGIGNIIQTVGGETADISSIRHVSAGDVIKFGRDNVVIVTETIVLTFESGAQGNVSKGMRVTIKALNKAFTLRPNPTWPLDGKTFDITVQPWATISVIFDGNQYLTLSTENIDL